MEAAHFLVVGVFNALCAWLGRERSFCCLARVVIPKETGASLLIKQGVAFDGTNSGLAV